MVPVLALTALSMNTSMPSSRLASALIVCDAYPNSARSLVLAHASKKLLRHVELHQYWLHFVDRDQLRRVGRRNNVSVLYGDGAGTSSNRRSQVRISEIDLCLPVRRFA